MSHHVDYSHLIFWIVFTAAAAIFLGWLLFRPVRGWMWGTWLWFKGLLLGKRAGRYDDVRRPGAEIDDHYNEIKSRYVNAALTDIKRWTSGPQKRLIKRLGTLRKAKEEAQEREAELQLKRAEERQNPSRERPRFKGPFYWVVAVLLALADVAITFMCLQSLDYPVIFLIPSAFILGIIGYLAGEYLGKNIEPAQKQTNKEKNRIAIVLFATFSVMYCIILGTIRFLYTQHDASVSPALNFFGSYGFIAIIVGCSVMLGWLHEGITTEELLLQVRKRRARIDMAIDRCDKQGAKMTDAFHAHLLVLESRSTVMRSQFRNGFDRAWLGRAPYGVQTPDSPLDYEEDMLTSLTWPDPPRSNVAVKPRPKRIVDLSPYEEPEHPAQRTLPEVKPPLGQRPLQPPPNAPSVLAQAPIPLPAQPKSSPIRPTLQDGPPPIG